MMLLCILDKYQNLLCLYDSSLKVLTLYNNSAQSRGGHWPPFSSNGLLVKLEWAIFYINVNGEILGCVLFSSEIK